jgi:DNA mismatch repair protein MutL
MGFRGEALASISAISEVMVISKTKNSDLAYQIDSKNKQISGVEHPLGTTVIVKNLFYNTPARRKYLKSDATEFQHISDLIQRYALALPDMSFSLFKEKHPSLRVPNGIDEISRISYIYGNLIAKNLCPINFENEFIKITGFAGKPTIARESGDYISIFVNGRYVKSDLINSSIIDAYRSMLFLKRKPVVILKILLDPKRIDVNVHPSKLTIKFDNEQLVYYSVDEAIKKTLKENNLIESQEIKRPKYVYPPRETSDLFTNNIKSAQKPFFKSSLNDKEAKYAPTNSTLTTLDGFGVEDSGITSPNKKRDLLTHSSIFSGENRDYPTTTVSKNKEPQSNGPRFRALGQVHKTYIVAESANGLAIIDQHAACERVNFEKVEREYKEGGVTTQKLLKPFLIFLNQKYRDVLRDKREYFQRVGFEIDEFGENELIVRSIPLILGREINENEANILVEELAQNFLDKSVADIIDQKILSTIACKKSIKAGEELSLEQMKTIIKQLFECSNPYTCPHGRPTIIEFNEENLEKLFKRIA